MKEKTNNLLQKALEVMGDNSDILIIAHKDGKCGAVVHGSNDTIAQAIFACMHQPGNAIGTALYQILRLNAMNIVGNNSKFASDLMNSIIQAMPKDEDGKE